MGATKAANTPSGGLPAPGRPDAAEPQTQRRHRKAAWRVHFQSKGRRSPPLPPPLEPGVPDPEGTLEELGLVQPREFWQWYHAEDGPPGPRDAHMGAKWGEFWTEFLLSDPLVLAGAVPLVLHKRAQMTGVRDERGVRLAEFQALRKLRERLGRLDGDGAAVDGLVVAICGRVNVNIQHGEPELAVMHLRAIARLAGMQQLTGTAWICAVFTDLRTVSPTQLAPLLHRSVPSDWQTCALPLPPDGMQACQRSAMSNMRSLTHVGSANFNLTYSIFKQLHEFDATAVTSAEQPIKMLYHMIYDCCVLDSSDCAILESALATQAQLLNICLKLCAWERASRYVPRGGEIERALLGRARQLLGGNKGELGCIAKFPGGANSSAMLWMMFCLTATAYMFERGEMGTWIEHLRAVAPVTTASGLQRALKGWPLTPWWLTHALRRICNDLAPKRGQWQVVSDEPEPVPQFSTGLRLKLLVIGD